jgi:hypothetical protein
MENAPRPVWDFATFAPLVPIRGWIRDYLAYAIQCTDAPPLYHILAALTLVALAISPDHVLNVCGETHPLHLFVMIVGGSGQRKSAAIKRALKVIHPCLTRQGINHRIWYPEASSIEGIFDGLMADPHRLMVASEWTDLHGINKATYNQHSQEMFNLIYDASPLTRLKVGQQLTIPKPCVSILGASTPGLVRGATSLRDWEAGKLARYLIGYQHKPAECEMPASMEQPNLVTDLQVGYDLLLSSSLASEFVLSQDAWNMKVGWEQGEQWRNFRAGLPEHLQPSAYRVSEHLYRVAALYQASVDYPHNSVVSEDSMWRAISLVWFCMQSTQEVFGLLTSDERNPIIKTLQILKMFGIQGVDHRELLRRTHLPARQLKEVLETLRARGELNTAVRDGKLQHYYRMAVNADDLLETV